MLARRVPQGCAELVFLLGLGTPGLPKTTWPINHYGIPLGKTDDFSTEFSKIID